MCRCGTHICDEVCYRLLKMSLTLSLDKIGHRCTYVLLRAIGLISANTAGETIATAIVSNYPAPGFPDVER